MASVISPNRGVRLIRDPKAFGSLTQGKSPAKPPAAGLMDYMNKAAVNLQGSVTSRPVVGSNFPAFNVRLPHLKREVRQKQPEDYTREPGEQRHGEQAAEATATDRTDANRGNCSGPVTRIIRYDRSEFFSYVDPIDDDTPI